MEETSQPETCQLGRERESELWVRLSLANAEANAVRVDKVRITSYRLSLSLSLSLQTDVATYRAAYGLSPLSIISLCLGLLFHRLMENNLTINLKKSHFLRHAAT